MVQYNSLSNKNISESEIGYINKWQESRERIQKALKRFEEDEIRDGQESLTRNIVLTKSVMQLFK